MKNKKEEKNEDIIKLKLLDIQRRKQLIEEEEKALKKLLDDREKPVLSVTKQRTPEDSKYKITNNNIRFVKKYKREWVQFLDDKGRVIEQEPLKDRTKKEIRNKLINDGTLKSNLQKVKLQNVTEYIDKDISLRRLKDKEKFQFAYSVTYNGKTITARSTQFNKSKANKEFAQKHAYNNMLRKLSYIANGVSDADVGAKILKDKNLKIRKSAIYYKKS
jgi:hypothetical protein